LAGQGAPQGFLQRVDMLGRDQFGADLRTLGWVVKQGQIRKGSGKELMTLLQKES
jgi:hypothetical protein